MVRILATAENFAFGPAGKLITVANALARRGHELTFAGYGTAYQLAARTNCWTAVEINTQAASFAEDAADLIAAADLVVSCVDTPSAQLALAAGKPVVWLDPLSWWWDEQPKWITDVDLHLVQRSITTATAGPARPGPGNQRVVGPIVEHQHQPWPPMASAQPSLLINFGGGEAAGWYQIGKDTNYPFLMVDILHSISDMLPFDTITLACNTRVGTECESRWPGSRFRFRCMDHSRFLRALSSSTVFLTVPGLEAPLEAWAHHIPTIFLPPSNSSQYVQLDEYRRRGVASLSIHLRDYLPGLDLMSMPLRQRSRAFLAQLREFEASPSLHDDVARRLTSALGHTAGFGDLRNAGDEYFASLGGNGLPDAVEAIETLIHQRHRR